MKAYSGSQCNGILDPITEAVLNLISCKSVVRPQFAFDSNGAITQVVTGVYGYGDIKRIFFRIMYWKIYTAAIRITSQQWIPAKSFQANSK